MTMKKLSLIGLGIVDERSVSLKGIDSIMVSERVFAEFFTSILKEGSIERLEELIGKNITILNREDVEEKELVLGSFEEVDNVCFLTAGDPLAATTHQELRKDAIDRGYEVEIINSGSIFIAAAGYAGLQHYKFGRTTTLGYPEGDYLPTSPLEVMIENHERGLHTLILLDIQANIGRYMTANEGCDVILKMVEKFDTDRINGNSMVVGIMRAGREDCEVVYSSLNDVKSMDLGPPPHCLILPGKLHFMEEEVLELFKK
jgi:diphthine synthase